jgi:hypothetical protein
MFSTFSSSVMPSASVTWKSWVLPTRQTAAVPAFRTPASTSSLSADRPARLVMPKAVMVARVSGPRRKTRCRWGSHRASRPRYSRSRGRRAPRRCGSSRAWRTARPGSAARRGGWCRRGGGGSRVMDAPRPESSRRRRSSACPFRATSTQDGPWRLRHGQPPTARPAAGAFSPTPAVGNWPRVCAHFRASSLAGSKPTPGINSTSSLDIRTSRVFSASSRFFSVQSIGFE